MNTSVSFIYIACMHVRTNYCDSESDKYANDNADSHSLTSRSANIHYTDSYQNGQYSLPQNRGRGEKHLHPLLQ